MWDMNEVIKIKYKTSYIYHIEFDNGLKGDVNFKEYIKKGPIFKPFKDLNFFKKAFISG